MIPAAVGMGCLPEFFNPFTSCEQRKNAVIKLESVEEHHNHGVCDWGVPLAFYLLKKISGMYVDTMLMLNGDSCNNK